MMTEVEEGGMPSEEHPHQLDSSSGSPEDALSAARTEDSEERSAEGGAVPAQQHPARLTDSPLVQFKLKRFFVLRVNTFSFPLVRKELCCRDQKCHITYFL